MESRACLTFEEMTRLQELMIEDAFFEPPKEYWSGPSARQMKKDNFSINERTLEPASQP